MKWPICDAAIQIIKDAEGLRLHAYRCPAGVWTIGYGHTVDVEPDDVVTAKEAEQMLADDVGRFAAGVRDLCTGSETPEQFGALVSLAYNIGLEAFAESTVLRLHRNGLYADASRAFRMWIRGGGHVLPGLIKRRDAEAQLYYSGSRGR